MTHEDLIKLQETNNKALVTAREMIGDHPEFKPDEGALDLLALLLYAERKLENDIAAVSHGKHV
jgi:hypothetical protein